MSEQTTFTKEELIRAVNACCTCGGNPSGAKGTCPACEVYHALTRPKAQPVKKEWCGLKDDPEFVQCCCNCVHHIPVHFHCGIKPEPEQKKSAGVDGRCVCKVQKGWACANPEMERIYDNWPEHSCGCECYTTAEDLKRDQERQRKALDLLFRTEHPNAPQFHPQPTTREER